MPILHVPCPVCSICVTTNSSSHASKGRVTFGGVVCKWALGIDPTRLCLYRYRRTSNPAPNSALSESKVHFFSSQARDCRCG